MAETYKRLGKASPSNGREAILYTTDSLKSAITTNISIANMTQEDKSFDIYVYDTEVSEQDIADSTIPGVYLASGDYEGTPSAISSTDGITWISEVAPEISPAVGSPGGIFTVEDGLGVEYVVVPQYNGQFLYSSDLTTWNTGDTGFGAAFTMASTNGTIMAKKSGVNAEAKTSTDMIFWNARTMPGSVDSTRIVTGNNKFLLLPNNGNGPSTYVFDPNTITWAVGTLPSSNTYPQGLYADNVFYALKGGTSGASSTDGISWTSASYGGGSFNIFQGPAVATDGSKALILMDYSSEYYVKQPGSLQLSIYNIPGDAMRFFSAYANGVWHLVNNNAESGTALYYSNDPTSFTFSETLSGKMQMYGGLTNFTIISPYRSPAEKIIYKNAVLAANESAVLEPGIVLGQESSILVSGDGLHFSLYGAEDTDPEKYSIIAQQVGDGAGQLINAYSVPNNKSLLIRSINIVNYDSQEQYYDIAFLDSGASSPQDGDYIAKSVKILPNETISIKSGYTMSSQQSIHIEATSDTVTFSVFGVII